VIAVEIKRPLTEYRVGDSGRSGRFHFLIRGTLAEKEFEVTWKRPAGSPSITIDSVATYSAVSTGDIVLPGPIEIGAK